jgi:hypothetical protein
MIPIAGNPTKKNKNRIYMKNISNKIMSGFRALTLTSMLLLASAFVNAATPTVYYSDPSQNDIVSFDWLQEGRVEYLFYQTATPSYGFGGFYRYGTASGILTTLQPPSGSRIDYPGASVLTIDNTFVYFNASDLANGQSIFKYNGSTTLDFVSNTSNYGLYTDDTDMFISGSGSGGVNNIFYAPVTATGTLGTVEALGKTNGASGPMIFDGRGNLYYAEGYGDTSIYKWNPDEVAAAILDPISHPLMADITHLWHNYSSEYPNAAGGTSMAISPAGDQVLLTLTNFSGPSLLAEFGISTLGTYDNTTSVLYSSNSRLGEVRVRGIYIYLAEDSNILRFP